MKIISLSPEERQYHLATHKVNIKFSDLAAIPITTPTAQQLVPAAGKTVPAGSTVRFAGFALITPFDGGATSSLTIQLGDGGSAARFLAATEIHLDATEVLYANAQAVTQPYTYLVADGIDATWTCLGAAGSALTTGEIDVFFHITDRNQLARIQ